MIQGFESSEILELHWQTPELLCLTVKRLSNFAPGDCVNISIDGINSHPFCIASGTNEAIWTFWIRLVPGGLISHQLLSLHKGDAIWVGKPFGWMDLKSSDAVFVATGTGIAPFLAHLKSGGKPPQALFYGTTDRSRLIEEKFLREKIPNVYFCLSKEGPLPGFYHGRVTDAVAQFDIRAEQHWFLCGLHEMVDEVSRLAEKGGIDYFSNLHQAPFYFNKIS